MNSLPHYLQSFRKQAEALLNQQRIGHIEFSGRTYQIQMHDLETQKEVWAFLQLDGKGAIRDRFCSCEEIGDESACRHLAAAYLRIFSEHPLPLHRRFQISLWNQLCQWYAGELGDNSTIIEEVEKGEYRFRDSEGHIAVSLKGLTTEGKDKLRAIFFERDIETEETSLKFSNLSQEEIQNWRQGRPSFQLKYELSFWNDLAKWLMLMQESGEKYTVAFDYSEKKMPQGITIQFPKISFQCSLAAPDLLGRVIPALTTISSPLAVFVTAEDSIEKLSYNEKTGELKVLAREFQQKEQLEKEGAIYFRDWLYMPYKGFYSCREHPLLKKPILSGHAISDALNAYHPLIKSLLKDVPLHEEAVTVSYTLAFDDAWSLSIRSYLFEPGDLEHPYSRFFGDWAYIVEKGFYPVEDAHFPTVNTVIAKEHVGNFVRQHRVWLNLQDGFHIHLSGIETKLAYSLIEGDQLVFYQKALIEEEVGNVKDFGSWIYLSGQGFFSKEGMPDLSVPLGQPIHPKHIPSFIRNNRDELSLIPGFFSRSSPYVHVGVEISLTEENKVLLTPKYEKRPKYQNVFVKAFDGYTFVEGEGFYSLPKKLQLPERLRHPLLLEKESFVPFFTHELDTIKNYILSIDPRVLPPESLHLVAEQFFKKERKYFLTLCYQSEKGFFPVTRLWEAMQRGEGYLFSDAGLVDVDDDRFRWIKSFRKKSLDLEKNQVILSSLEVLRLHAFEPFNVLQGEETLDALLTFSVPEEPDATLLASSLRSYQTLGLHWLWFLYHQQFSGLLCDDMGLGKTHQAMGLLAAIMSKKRKEQLHFLVVCPTSVIYHWEEKLQAFLPHARVCTFHGSNRSLKDFRSDYDILLTSYGIWRNECELLDQVSFEVAIFDEIQAAKNQKTRIHASLLKVDAVIRLGLTGTPIENRLKELKALFDIILPNFFPSEQEYKKFFVIPIEKEDNRERRELLSRLIKPFILRRKKKEVLLDLPEKTEEIAHCELSLEQRLLYNDVLRKVRDGIMREIEDKNVPIPYIHIFSVLSSLKQICNHPAAYLKNPEAFQEYQSGKWDLFVELLGEALSSGQKVVVFSQYLAMLDIIEQFLQGNRIGYATIRGATKKRKEEVLRFNQDPSCEVFIGSLQAAGLGIDLTAGSVVIHYDRWWNAAREDQATDRVHRIGQTRGVQVFKLVTKKTFEERIDEMIVCKGKFMEEIIGYDDHRFMKQFDRNELIQLLQDVGE